MLTLYLRLELLIGHGHLVDLLFELDLLLIEPLLISILHTLRNVSTLVLILLCLLVCEVRYTLQIFCGL